MKWVTILYGQCGTNWLHRRKVSTIDVVLLQICQATPVNLVLSNPASQIDPVIWIARKIRHLLFGHIYVEIPLCQQGHDLFDIEVCEGKNLCHLQYLYSTLYRYLYCNKLEKF